MARSRRNYRRTTSQRAVSLLASTLPAPIQRIADTSLGSSAMMLGIPALVIAGVLNLQWDGLIPSLNFDSNRASELRNVARDELGRISNSPNIQHWERSATELWNASQSQIRHSNASAPYSNTPSYPPLPSNSYGDSRVPTSTIAGPSSSSARNLSPTLYPQASSPSSSYSNSINYSQSTPTQHPYNSQLQQPSQSAYYQQPQYNQPTYNQPTYHQPTYNQQASQPTYRQPTVQPSYNQGQYYQSYQQPVYGQWRQ